MRRILDEKGRLGGKVSVIDLAIVLVVIVIAIGAVLKFTVIEQTAVTVDTLPVRYTLEIPNVRDVAYQNIRPGDTVFSAGTNVGTVAAVSMEPHQLLIQGQGAAWWGEVPDRYTLFVEVEATATVTEAGRVMVSRTVAMGAGTSTIQLYTRYAELRASIREITVDD